MKKSIWLFVVLFVAVTVLVAQPANSQEITPSQTAFSVNSTSSLLQRGQPLPGQNYPAQQTSVLPSTNDPLLVDIPEGIDLDVTFINRTPMYHAYCVTYPAGVPLLCPGSETEKRWPEPGELVTFTAHIVNKGTVSSPGFNYAWHIDEIEVASGSLPALAAGGEITAVYQWPWGHIMDGERVVDDHTIRFTVDPTNLIPETYKINNSLQDRTNALGLRIAITPAMIQAYNIPWNPAFSYSAEDWLQRQIAAMNWLFEQAVYPTTPTGITERVRINSIEVTNTPPVYDGVPDGGWFVDNDYRLASGGYDPVADVDWSLVHELSHQVGLIDLYRLNIAATDITVLDRYNTPSNFAFTFPHGDLMGGGDISPYTNPHFYSSHSAAGISSTKGYRRGYYGEYQFDIPAQNDLLILNNQGDPAAGVTVSFYQRTGAINWLGDHVLDNVPEITGVTDANGRFALPNRSVNGGITTQTGHTLHNNPFGPIDVVGTQNLFLVKLAYGDHEEFFWLNILDFNLAYWQGNTLTNTFTISSHVPTTYLLGSPYIFFHQAAGDQSYFCWTQEPPAAIGYYVYRAAPPTYTYERITNLLTDTCFTDVFTGGNRVYAVTAVLRNGLESGFNRVRWGPRLINPADIGLLSDGTRITLDPQNGYALLRQDKNGRYLQNIGSPHYHLEFSQYLAVDEANRLIISHPADYYSSRHSVRIADQYANPILEFGQQGSGPGQFQTPAGVAAWGHPLSIEGPYTDDAHTLLLLHFDGNYTGAQGEPGTPNGTSFTDGRYNQGVSINDNDTLTYAAANNLNRTQGAIEFWIRPNWNGNDFINHNFFEIGNQWFNRLRITKDGANNLRFIVWNSTTETGVATSVSHWVAGEWHHVAATWSGSTIALYVDGQKMAQLDSAYLPDSLANTIYIGSTLWGDLQADATIEEFRISDVPRIGNSDTQYRIVVADSGNHRLQVFDELGQFITSFGSFGTGAGQFNHPQGLAINPNGQIWVVDQGNNRLQLFNFNGSSFTFVQQVTADLSNPTHIDTFEDGRVVVADTGHHLIKILSPDGVLLAAYHEPTDGYSGPFFYPQGVAVINERQILVADAGNRRVAMLHLDHPIFLNPILISTDSSSWAGDTIFDNDDIAVLDPITHQWEFYFDGSDVGLHSTNLDAFYQLADGSLLISLNSPMTLRGVGLVDDSDIVRFVPSSLGETTQGVWELYFDGSDVGLTGNGEDVDVVTWLENGRFLISTNAAVTVPGVQGNDEDLLIFTPVQLGQTTIGSWELYFDGSDVGLTYYDITGNWIDETSGDIYLSFDSEFTVDGISGNGGDIIGCHPANLGGNTTCDFDPALFWDGSEHLVNGFLDGFGICRESDCQ